MATTYGTGGTKVYGGQDGGGGGSSANFDFGGAEINGANADQGTLVEQGWSISNGTELEDAETASRVTITTVVDGPDGVAIADSGSRGIGRFSVDARGEDIDERVFLFDSSASGGNLIVSNTLTAEQIQRLYDRGTLLLFDLFYIPVPSHSNQRFFTWFGFSSDNDPRTSSLAQRYGMYIRSSSGASSISPVGSGAVDAVLDGTLGNPNIPIGEPFSAAIALTEQWADSNIYVRRPSDTEWTLTTGKLGTSSATTSFQDNFGAQDGTSGDGNSQRYFKAFQFVTGNGPPTQTLTQAETELDSINIFPPPDLRDYTFILNKEAGRALGADIVITATSHMSITLRDDSVVGTDDPTALFTVEGLRTPQREVTFTMTPGDVVKLSNSVEGGQSYLQSVANQSIL